MIVDPNAERDHMYMMYSPLAWSRSVSQRHFRHHMLPRCAKCEGAQQPRIVQHNNLGEGVGT